MEQGQKLFVTSAWRKRQVQDRAATGAKPFFIGIPGAGIAEAGMFMDTDIQRIRLVLKGRLNAVAMMGVKVKNHYPLAAITLLPVAGGNYAVIDKTEAKGPDPLGMMTGRPHQTKGLFRLAQLQQINGSQTGTGRQSCHLIGIITDLVVEMINKGLSGENRLFKTKEPPFIMGFHEPLPFRRTHLLKIKKWKIITLLQRSMNDLEPSWNLGMITPRVVIKKAGIGNEVNKGGRRIIT